MAIGVDLSIRTLHVVSVRSAGCQCDNFLHLKEVISVSFFLLDLINIYMETIEIDMS